MLEQNILNDDSDRKFKIDGSYTNYHNINHYKYKNENIVMITAI